MRGGRGQSLLRELLTALREMPDKALIAHEIVDDHGEVCLLGAGGRRRGFADLKTLDPTDHDALAKRFNVAACLIQEIEWVNDEASYKSETPSERYERVLRWLTENIRD
jgi:hypothetical protein